MSEWEETRLGEVLELITDYHSNGSYEILKANVSLLDEEDFAVMIRTTNFEQNNFSKNLKYVNKEAYFFLDKSMVFPGDIIMNKIANAGSVYFMPDLQRPVSLAMNLFLIRVNKEKANQRFVFYYLKANEAYVKQFAEGSVTKTITKNAVRNLVIRMPSLERQNEIVKIIESVESKIENLRRQNETLERIAQTLFKHWFVDFEFPNADGKPYKSSGGAMVRSELGEVPSGWRIGKLRDITAVINGRAYKQTEFREEGTPIVRIQNLTGKGQNVYSDLILENEKYISKGDLIYAWSATFGPYIWRGVKSIYHYHIWKLNCFNPAFKYYLYIHLKNVSDRVKNQGTGSIFTHITKELMESQEILIPDNRTIECWHDLAESAFDKIMLNYEQIATLTNTRDVLLPQLMSGKLRVKP
uniref:Restriction modification system DNA specificity domain protein n=1 Tax=Cyanothece sp. (strain PCC 7425 / ATCC 29141) TaxID=395961 RepID=B8HN03_CYAP4